MAQVLFKGSPMHTRGSLPAVGTKAPDFKLTTGDLRDVGLAEYKGKRKILSVVHSLDTGTCAVSTRRFNTEATRLPDTVVLVISNDLPFAQKRFCEAEKIANVVPLSQMRNRDFGKTYGMEITDGPIAGLLARSIIVIDESDKVVYTEQVQETTKEPDYEKALAAARK
ncbi:MAG TPA: thiol peroxidase [Spirochaetia bacterium]|nr:thiol peroxidase [Spirochaetia bacterium]